MPVDLRKLKKKKREFRIEVLLSLPERKEIERICIEKDMNASDYIRMKLFNEGK